MDVKKVAILVGAAVLIYTLIAHPTQLGDGVQTILGWVGDAVQAVIDFFQSVVN